MARTRMTERMAEENKDFKIAFIPSMHMWGIELTDIKNKLDADNVLFHSGGLIKNCNCKDRDTKLDLDKAGASDQKVKDLHHYVVTNPRTSIKEIEKMAHQPSDGSTWIWEAGNYKGGELHKIPSIAGKPDTSEKKEWWKSASITARLDVIAGELEAVDPRLALALDRVSDQLEYRIAYNEVEDDIAKIIEHLESPIPGGSIPGHRSERGNYWVNDHYRAPQVNFKGVDDWLLNREIIPRMYASDTGEDYEGTEKQFNYCKKLFLDLLKTSKKISSYDIEKMSEIVDSIKPDIKARLKK